MSSSEPTPQRTASPTFPSGHGREAWNGWRNAGHVRSKNDAFYNLAGLAILKLCLYYNTTRNGMQVRIGAPAT